MDRIFRTAFLLVPVILTLSCTPGTRTVENPLIDTANTFTLDISKVEISDSATVLYINADYIPHYWIRISSDTYLAAKGRKYPMTGTDGIQADSLYWMPDSGKASFRLMFGPLPRNVRSFDFIESDSEDSFRLYGVDLTGKTVYDKADGVPDSLLAVTGDMQVPEPEFAIGMTTVRLHLLNYRPELTKRAFLYVNTLLNGQQEYVSDIDPETCTAEFRFRQYGPANAMIVTGPGSGTIWTAPGEDIDVYYDMRVTGFLLQKSFRQEDDWKGKGFRTIYSTGKYSGLTNAYDSASARDYFLWMFTGEFARYDMTADEYVAHVTEKYRSLADSIAHSSAGRMLKEIQLITLKQETVSAFALGDMIRTHNYMNVYDDWTLWNSGFPGLDRMRKENYAAVCSLFDINDPMLLMGAQMLSYIDAVTVPDIGWEDIAGTDSGLVPSLRKVSGLAQKAENAALSEQDFRMLEDMDNPFYLEAFRTMQADTEAALAAVGDKAAIEKTPDVGNAELFDAIIAPHRGKIVLVDFWNTWCGPCKGALEMNEPLKSTELKSDDIVWIYIANETSPLVEYKTMIPDIKGLHYRLNDGQWKYLRDKFNIDGIPSYVLVDREGKYGLRNDFRDHGKMVSTLKGMLDIE